MVGVVPSMDAGVWRVVSGEAIYCDGSTWWGRVNSDSVCECDGLRERYLRGWRREFVERRVDRFVIRKFVCGVVLGLGAVGASAQETDDARVVLVMTDGLRWQEVFRGADASLLVPE